MAPAGVTVIRHDAVAIATMLEHYYAAIAEVACGEIGPEPHRRWDVFGAGVNHLFRMGGGGGLRISEPAYRQLPNERRGAWRKDDPPAIYHYEP